MKQLLSTLVLITFAMAVSAQTTTLTFTGRDANNHFIPLNRIEISNLTKGWQETIYYPDTTLTMQTGTGIENHLVENTFALLQNNPNPFNGATEADLCVVVPGVVLVEISDVNGRIVETQKFASLQAGNHRFRIQISAAGIYFMTARQKGQSSTIKMVNNGNGGENSVEYVGLENQRQVIPQTKSCIKGATDNPFSLGDNMMYVGYATFNDSLVESQTIQQQQSASENFTLQFNAVQLQLPVVTTDQVTAITQTSATCGGNVTDDGGAEVTDRGVCYNTTGTPTISDSSVHSGAGVGSFSINLTDLTASTTYYVRSYAINSVGVAYGSTEFFTTSAPTLDGQPCPDAATLTDVDGNVYNTVKIGRQCWMKENLRTTKFADGTNISLSSDTSSFTAFRYYPNNDTSNVSAYGYLYNWTAVMHDSTSSSSNSSGVQGVCPEGWHVPSDTEWTQLANYVKSQSVNICEGCSGTDDEWQINCIAKALASTTGWDNSTSFCAVGNNANTNNATNFTAVPAGTFYGEYSSFGSSALFWSSTVFLGSYAYSLTLYYDNAYVNISADNFRTGLSVRCLKD